MRKFSHVLELMLFVMFLMLVVSVINKPFNVSANSYITSMMGFSPGLDSDDLSQDLNVATANHTIIHLMTQTAVMRQHTSYVGLHPT